VSYCLVSFIIKALISVAYLVWKLGISDSDKVLLPVYVLCLTVDCFIIVTQTVLFNVNGFKVMRVIGNQTKALGESTKRKAYHRVKVHYSKITGLQLAMSFCALFQLLAVIFEPLTRMTGMMIWGPVRDLVNSIGILSFAIVVLFLYNPMLIEKPRQYGNLKRGQGEFGSGSSFGNNSCASQGMSPRKLTPKSAAVCNAKVNFLSVDYNVKEEQGSVGSSASSCDLSSDSKIDQIEQTIEEDTTV